jgi:probable H4MPT-linked C1 transfer pathway protein
MSNSKTIIIVGIDIGGANTKAALIVFNNGLIVRSFSIIEYFPFWEKSIKQIPEMLFNIRDNLFQKAGVENSEISYFAIAITAELSDAFQTKREGINVITKALSQVFDEEKLFFISTNGHFIKIDDVFQDFSQICAANWVSTALFLGEYAKDGILIDSGSTTIDLIPVINGTPSTQGRSDLGRLSHHELIYTGGLRATIPSITHFVPIDNGLIRISFEKFALISDVHLILNNISEREYFNDTADNRSKSMKDCYARLSRIICADLESVSNDQLFNIANYIYQKQLKLISSEIKLFLEETEKRLPEITNSLKFFITGLSAKFLIKPVLEKLGYNEIYNYEEKTNIPDNISSSAFALAGALYFQLYKGS